VHKFIFFSITCPEKLKLEKSQINVKHEISANLSVLKINFSKAALFKELIIDF